MKMNLLPETEMVDDDDDDDDDNDDADDDDGAATALIGARNKAYTLITTC